MTSDTDIDEILEHIAIYYTPEMALENAIDDVNRLVQEGDMYSKRDQQRLQHALSLLRAVQEDA